MKNNRLLIFNLSMDCENPILSFTNDWVTHFAKHFASVLVFTVHYGAVDVPSNVKIMRIGGGTSIKRLVGLIKLLFLAIYVIVSRNYVVFHHMLTRTLVFPGIIFKIFKIRQCLWYSHSVADRYLKIGVLLRPHIFTVSDKSFPLTSSRLKIESLGHGIELGKVYDLESPRDHRTILCAGRVSPIKHLELLIEALCFDRETDYPFKIALVGPIEDEEYFDELLRKSRGCGIETIHLGIEQHHKMPRIYQQYSILFSGTPKSTDKVALEAAYQGCFIVSPNISTLRICGMEELDSFKGEVDQIRYQIQQILEYSETEILAARRRISESVARNGDLTLLSKRISNYLVSGL